MVATVLSQTKTVCNLSAISSSGLFHAHLPLVPKTLTRKFSGLILNGASETNRLRKSYEADCAGEIGNGMPPMNETLSPVMMKKIFCIPGCEKSSDHSTLGRTEDLHIVSKEICLLTSHS